jgi:hypothetical protein
MAIVVPSQIVAYIDTKFPAAAERKSFYVPSDYLASVAYVLSLVDNLPASSNTLQGASSVEFGEAVEALRVAVTTWNRGDKQYKLEKLTGGHNLNPLAVLRKHLATLSDDLRSPVTSELDFIKDDDFRSSLRVDIAAAHRALGVADWKGCTVVGGSVVEALLLWALDQREAMTPKTIAAAAKSLYPGVLSRPPHNDHLRWGLEELTEVAASLRIIGTVTAGQCRLAREFRNLIHPGRAIRLSIRPTLGTALSALAAVQHVVEELERTHRPSPETRVP